MDLKMIPNMKTRFLQIVGLGILISAFGVSGCDDSNDDNEEAADDGGTDIDSDSDIDLTLFEVTIENVAGALTLGTSGAFAVPLGASEPAPAFPGDSYEFSFYAEMDDKLSFATMFVHSNDLIYATPEAGIPLYDEMGKAISGDITMHVGMYDVGTEVNQPLGEGADQPVQGGGETGAADENAMVRMVDPMSIGAPAVGEVISVMMVYEMGMFTVTLENVSDDMTLMLSDMRKISAPFSPGAFAIHKEGIHPLFTTGTMDKGMGLEKLAEGGDPMALLSHLEMMTGPSGPITPGVYAVHPAGMNPIFMEYQVDMGNGLEELAEGGDPSVLAAYLKGMGGNSGVFLVPDGMMEPAPAFPAHSYRFSLMAKPGDYLSFASMMVKSNDLFFAPSNMGIMLFDGDTPVSGDVTSQIYLWDAGTEVNEVPGFGPNQPLNQTDMTTASDEMGPVMMVDDGYVYPEVNQYVRVTIAVQ